MEQITEINELAPGTGLDGFKVTTTEQEITLGISNIQNCSEEWGYF